MQENDTCHVTLNVSVIRVVVLSYLLNLTEVGGPLKYPPAPDRTVAYFETTVYGSSINGKLLILIRKFTELIINKYR